jgi:hypothetical protein
MMRNTVRFLVATSALALVGCGSDNPGGASGTGGHAGGSQGSGGATVSSGGSDGSGGSVGTGGSMGSGGTVESGGAPGSGGKTGSGGNTGNGGSTGSGGIATGGTTGRGGAGSGGNTGNGGSAAGGTTGNGGSAAGGTTGNGGSAAGGTTGNGGSAAGGATGSGGLGAGGKTGAGGSTGATLHVFLLLGQSNMAGYAKAQTSDKENSPRIRVIGFDDCSATGRKKDQWADAAPPLHECWNSAVGPGDSFSKTLLDKIPAGDSILLVPCALSGKSINDFKKGTSNYTWFISRAKSAVQLGGVIEGFLFHQGESDCGQSTWPATVAQFVTDLRTDLGLGNNPPFLAGELPYSSACTNHNPLVAKLAGLVTNGYVVSAQGLNLDPADTAYHMHFGHDDTVELGKRFEAKMVEALKW